MNKSAEYLLLRLYKKNKLAPFYIIRGPISYPHCPLLEWSFTFAAKILELEKSISSEQAQELIKLGHRDLLFITKSEAKADSDEGYPQVDEKNYKVDDPLMREYFKAVQYGPMDLKQKFIFIDKGQLIGDYFANKWLKTLEEPEPNVTTIFLVENQTPLLHTIESRAITFRVQKDHPEKFYHILHEHEDFVEFLGRHYPHWTLPPNIAGKVELFVNAPHQIHLLIETLKESAILKRELYQLMNDYILATNHNLYAQQHWLDEIQWFHQAEVFNNSQSERFYGLLRCVIESQAHKQLSADQKRL
jgi:hypothetical protein